MWYLSVWKYRIDICSQASNLCFLFVDHETSYFSPFIFNSWWNSSLCLMWHIAFDPPHQKFQTLNRIIFFHSPFLIAPLLIPQMRSTPKLKPILYRETRPAFCEKKLQSENLFHTQLYQIFSICLALFLGLFTFSCSPCSGLSI